MTPSEKYTAAAYLVVFVGLLAYILIIAAKLQRIQRELADVVERLRERETHAVGGHGAEAHSVEGQAVEEPGVEVQRG